MIDKSGAAAIEADMPEEWLDWPTVAGRPEDCLAGIDALFDAGATMVVLFIVPAKQLPTRLENFGGAVLPSLQKWSELRRRTAARVSHTRLDRLRSQRCGYRIVLPELDLPPPPNHFIGGRPSP